MANNNLCPICQQPAIRTCRCFRGDSVCINGHEWHTCVPHQVLVIGQSDHSTPTGQCTCGNKLIQNAQ